MAEFPALPEPLTPPDADLRDFIFMPLDVVRFAQSDLVAFEEPAAVLAALLLWGVSWHSLPAGSLTDDDRTLARAAGYGRGLTEWNVTRDGALRGWIKCSDGRLYHPVVAEKVIHAWTGKLRQRHRTYCAAIRKHNERNPENKLESPSFEQWEEDGRPEKVTRDSAGMSHSEDSDVTRKTASLSRSSHTKKPSKGEGEGEGEGDITPNGVAAAKRGSRLRADFVVPPEWIAWAVAEEKLSRNDADREAASFIDYWVGKAGRDAAKSDWLATWRNWCRKSHSPRTSGKGSSLGADDPRVRGGMVFNSPC